MDTLFRELGLAARGLNRSRGFTAVAVLTLALSIGANTTIFTWASAVFLEPLPGVADSGRVLVMQQKEPGNNEGYVSLSYPDYRDYRDRNTTLAGLAVTRNVMVALESDGNPERLYGQIVSGNFFDVLGVRASLGRTFAPEDDRAPGESPVLVISHAFWQRHFGGDPSVVGRAVRLNKQPFTIVGVMPREFRGSSLGLRLDVWVPVMMQGVVEPGSTRLEERGNRWLEGLGRLGPGVSRETAQAELTQIAAQIGAERKTEGGRGRSVGLFPIARSPRGGGAVLGPVMLVLASVVGLVLLIACANVANLLLTRAVAREREMAVRLSLGARRRDLVRQLLVESLLLAALGGGLGVLLASWGEYALQAMLPPTDYPLGLAVGLNGRALVFTLAVTTIAGLLFGLVPALQATRGTTSGALREGSGAVAGGRRRQRLRNALVVTQVAASVLLLVTAGLFLRSLDKVRSFDLGLDPKGVSLASVDLVSSGYDATRGTAFYRSLLERARALPGVGSVSLVRRVPLGLGGSSSTTLEIEGYEAPKDDPAWGYVNNVGPDFLRTLGIRLVDGREFSVEDDGARPGVIIVNQTMARRYWADGKAVGHRVRLDESWATVVGVARDTPFTSVQEPPGPTFYVPILQRYRPDATVLLRAQGDTAAYSTALVGAIHALDPSLAVFGLRSLEDHVQASAFRQRLGSQVLGAFGLLGLALAMLGLYGVLAFSVAQRTREMGIRTALGASVATLLRLVLHEGLRLAVLGVVLGAGLALAVGRLFSGLLVGVSPVDPATFAVTIGSLLLAASLACAVPARRATRVDPAVALRHE
jgi:predicted permease